MRPHRSINARLAAVLVTLALRLARQSLASMPLASVQLFSASRGMGLEQARQRIMQLLGSGAQAGPTT